MGWFSRLQCICTFDVVIFVFILKFIKFNFAQHYRFCCILCFKTDSKLRPLLLKLVQNNGLCCTNLFKTTASAAKIWFKTTASAAQIGSKLRPFLHKLIQNYDLCCTNWFKTTTSAAQIGSKLRPMVHLYVGLLSSDHCEQPSVIKGQGRAVFTCMQPFVYITHVYSRDVHKYVYV